MTQADTSVSLQQNDSTSTGVVSTATDTTSAASTTPGQADERFTPTSSYQSSSIDKQTLRRRFLIGASLFGAGVFIYGLSYIKRTPKKPSTHYTRIPSLINDQI